MAQNRIELLIAEYLSAHPDYKYPETGDRHPSILAIGSQIQPWLVDKLGGRIGYWNAMLTAAETWFSPVDVDTTREHRLFCYFLEAEACIGGTKSDAYSIQNRYVQWRRLSSPGFAPGYKSAPNPAVD